MKHKYICCLITSNENHKEIVDKCDSIFFSDSYLCEMLFRLEDVVGYYMGYYDNTAHLKRCYKKISLKINHKILYKK